MAIQFSVAVRNARADAVETAIGASAILRVRSGAMPASCAAADTGTVLATVALPADWMAAAAGGVKSRSGTWEDLSADAAGTVGHFRIYDAAGTTCHWQGTMTATGGGGDMTVDNAVFAAGQAFTVNTFSLTEANA
jgi:hypothetical protein